MYRVLYLWGYYYFMVLESLLGTPLLSRDVILSEEAKPFLSQDYLPTSLHSHQFFFLNFVMGRRKLQWGTQHNSEGGSQGPAWTLYKRMGHGTQSFNLRTAGLWFGGLWIWRSEFETPGVFGTISLLLPIPLCSLLLLSLFSSLSLCTCYCFCQECPSQIFALANCLLSCSQVSLQKSLPLTTLLKWQLSALEFLLH